jgi:gamma-glutamyltranspeptidase/glutathione hydrolase
MSVDVAHGTHGIVASGHKLATEAAIEVLKSGGNAIDAAVCGALVLAVVCPYACSLAGDMYMLIHKPDIGSVIGLNATGKSPANATLEHFPEGIDRSGIRSATVPGMLAGMSDALDRYGTMSLRALLAPAIRIAAEGFTVHPYFTKNIEDRKGLLSRDPTACDLFLPDGHPLKPGSRFVQTDLAATLSLIAKDGISSFYSGKLAKQFVVASRKLGGLFSEADLSGHSSLWQTPISAPFFDYDVWTMPPNSYGATLLLQLIELEAKGIHRCDSSSVPFITQGFEARRAAYASTARYIADPDVAEDKAYNALQVAINDRGLRRGKQGQFAEASDSSTTNIVVIDQAGNAVSLIESISTPFGAGLVIENTGMVLNNRLAGFNTDPLSLNCLSPRKRPAHTLAPCIVTKNGALYMSIGTPGTVGQTCTLAQVLARILAHGEAPDAAISAPRWSVDFEGKLIIEASTPDPLLEEARAAGARTMPSGWISFGSIKLVLRNGAHLSGYADDRRSASTAGF